MFGLVFIFAISACDRTAPIMGTSKPALAKGQSSQTSLAYTQFPDIPIPSGAVINMEKTLIFILILNLVEQYFLICGG